MPAVVDPVAEGVFAPGHLGELTQIVPFEMVDAVLAETRTTQRRTRVLPSRVVVYVLLAAALFAECGYRQVWARLVAGLDPGKIGRAAAPSAAALASARRRIGPAPLRELFHLLRTPAAAPGTRGTWWRGRLVCAIDGTMMCCPDTPANLVAHRKGGSNHGGTGYPMIRLLGLVACGTRTLLAAVFGPTSRGETRYAADLLPAMGTGMIVLADRNFDAADLIVQITGTGADVLIRAKTGRHGRKLPVLRRLPDGSYLSHIGPLGVRVIDAVLTTTAPGSQRVSSYRLITTVLDPGCSPEEIVRLYHQRWEIETAYCELKSTILGGRVLRARTPAGVEQEVYALLIAYQAIRIAIADTAIARPQVDPDRASFTVALNTARDQIIKAAGIITGTTETMVDIVGVIGRHVLADLLPPRRPRTSPRVVKRAISNYAPHTASGRLRGRSHNTATRINILTGAPP
ncbi:MAG: IS4 family transposase [Candidatus Dormibacteraeota bacterium]|nr:IS4 family transposase [Candidatus Dormibacteraeota bacterium]